MGTALGWQSGVVPGTAVTLQRDGSSDTALHATSDSLGVIRFPSALTGTYSISALRVVDSTERRRLPAGYTDVDALGSGGRIAVDTPSAVTGLTLPVSHRGSLVVSEYWFPLTLVEPGPYPYGGFLELYNNSDTTVYLDGLTFGNRNQLTSEGSAYNNCDRNMLTDSTGLWTEDLFRFPGSGHDHPVAPSGAVVLATDAVDHRVVNDSATDLSGADFEFIGPSDVDNPAVPNMINLVAHQTPLGHGWFPQVDATPFVALPLDPDTLRSQVVFTFNAKYYLVPRAAVIGLSLLEFVDSRYPECWPVLPPVFDAGPVILPYADSYWPSFKRKVLRYLPDGRAVLQNTRTSANDFEFTFPRTPGSVP